MKMKAVTILAMALVFGTGALMGASKNLGTSVIGKIGLS